MEWGLAIGLFAAAIAAILPGMGSAKAVGLAGETAAGVCAETPEASSKLTLLQLLPATQGIYGFVIAIVIMAKIGIMGGSGANGFGLNRVKANVEKAIGADILFNNEKEGT